MEKTVIEIKNFEDPQIINIFEFIQDKILYGVNDAEHYITARGSYIIFGPPYGNNWKEWSQENKIHTEYGVKKLKNAPKRVEEDIKRRYNQEKKEWMEDNNIDGDELKELDFLHKQYQTISKISQTGDNSLDKEIIETYRKTGKNCLTYLREIKSSVEWKKLTDYQGSQLCAALTGYIPIYDIPVEIIYYLNTNVSYFSEQYDPLSKLITDFSIKAFLELRAQNPKIDTIVETLRYLHYEYMKQEDYINKLTRQVKVKEHGISRKKTSK